VRAHVHVVCVRVYMCMHVCVRTCIYVFIRMCICICIRMHVYTCVYVCVCVFVHRWRVSVAVLRRVGRCHGCTCVFVCICMRMHMYVCMYVCMYVHYFAVSIACTLEQVS